MAVAGSSSGSTAAAALRIQALDSLFSTREAQRPSIAALSLPAPIAGSSLSGAAAHSKLGVGSLQHLSAVPVVGLALSVAWRLGQRSSMQRRSKTGRRAKPDEWRALVKSDGGQFVFDVELSKPLGVQLSIFPGTESSVGVSEIREGGSAHSLNEKIFAGDTAETFVLEGDEVIAVNGTPCRDAGIKKVVALVQEAGDTFTMTLARNFVKKPYSPIKVVFRPSGKGATMKRGGRLTSAVELSGADVEFNCTYGYCGTCWHRDVHTGKAMPICEGKVLEMPDPSMPMVLEPLSPEEKKAIETLSER